MGIVLEKIHSDRQPITCFQQMDHSDKTKCTIYIEKESNT